MAEAARDRGGGRGRGDLDEPGQTATVVRDSSRDARTRRRTLQVLGERFRATFPLAGAGTVTVGRGSDNLVSIDDPEISRHHVVLHLGDSIRLEDLGSSNGTRVAGRRLDPRESAVLQAGQVIEIGSTLLLVQERAVEPPAFRLWPHDYFEARLEEECRRCARTGAEFTVLHVRATPTSEAAVVERRLVALLPQLDVVARYVPGEYQVLVVGALHDLPPDYAARLGRGLSDGRVTARVGAATYPDDGRTVDELIAVASARGGGEDEPTQDAVDTPAAIVADPTLRGLLKLAEKVAAGSIHVLVCGETGVGKGVIADEIHRRSGRHVLEVLECAGLDVDEMQDTLHAEEATTRTIVLDEVAALSPDAQLALLRWVERTEKDETPSTRLVATTNADLETAIETGTFREDLYFRLEGARIHIPPLRARSRAIEPLAAAFAAEAGVRLGRSEVPIVSDEALTMLQRYHWPGNVRELRNVLRRAVLLAEEAVVLPVHLPAEKLTAAYARPEAGVDGVQPLRSVREQFREAERDRIVAALEQAQGNQTRAAKILGISRRTLIKRLDAYALPRPRKKTPRTQGTSKQ